MAPMAVMLLYMFTSPSYVVRRGDDTEEDSTWVYTQQRASAHASRETRFAASTYARGLQGSTREGERRARGVG